jgi:hypothetical protein
MYRYFLPFLLSLSSLWATEEKNIEIVEKNEIQCQYKLIPYSNEKLNVEGCEKKYQGIPTTIFYPTDDNKLYKDDAGQIRILIYLHGGPDIATHQWDKETYQYIIHKKFKKLPSDLAEAGFIVYVPDYRGSPVGGPKGDTYGTYYSAKTRYDAEDSREVIHFIKEEYKSSQIVGLFHSRGLYIGSYAWTKEPNLFDAVINIAGLSNVGMSRMIKCSRFQDLMTIKEKESDEDNADQWFSSFLLEDTSCYIRDQFTHPSVTEVEDQNSLVKNPVLDEKMNQEYSPLYQTLPKKPILCIQNRDDTQVTFPQTLEFVLKLLYAEHPVSLLLGDEGGHRFFYDEEDAFNQKSYSYYILKIVDFIKNPGLNNKSFSIKFNEQKEQEIFNNDLEKMFVDEEYKEVKQYQEFIKDRKKLIRNLKHFLIESGIKKFLENQVEQEGEKDFYQSSLKDIDKVIDSKNKD